MILFNSWTASLRWDHNFRVCAGDLVDAETMQNKYEGKLPEFYLPKTGIFMKIYCFFYIGVFCAVIVIGLLIALWVSYKTTYDVEERLPRAPDYEPAYQTALDDQSREVG